MSDLITPFIGTCPNTVVKWTNDELEKNRELITNGEGVKHCLQGRLYMARAAGILAF